MSTTIWKATLLASDVQEIEVPSGSEFLCAREQHGQICVWFRCDPEKFREKWQVYIAGTGHTAPPFGNTWTYLGTAALRDGDLMFHVFVREPT
jgi:hypothetical protein